MPDNLKIRIPESAIAELDAVGELNWDKGVGLQELIDWINQIVERFRPESINEAARSSAAFTMRSFRHYQTLACIDSPTRAGKSVTYGFKHYLQGLVIRKLLWEKVPSEQISKLMSGRNTGDLRRLLLEGIEIITAGSQNKSSATSSVGGTWKRAVLAPGIELHLESSRRPLTKQIIGNLVEEIRELL
jgi:hypothetical protein